MTRKPVDPLELAGFVDENGRVDPPLPLVPGYRPKTVWSHLNRGFLWAGWGTKPARGAAVPDLLRFIRLVDGTDRQIAEFARQHGVLRFCRHGVPLTHSGELRIAGENPRFALCSPLIRGGRFFEPFAWWRRMAAEARAILRISARHQADDTGDYREWRLLRESPVQPKIRRVVVNGSALERERLWLLDYVDVWMMIANVRPYGFRLARGGLNVGLAGGLPGSLAMQLLSAVTGTSGLAACAGCGNFFTVERKRSPRQHRYCSNCGRLASMRDASKRYRARKRQKQHST